MINFLLDQLAAYSQLFNFSGFWVNLEKKESKLKSQVITYHSHYTAY